MGKSFSLRTDEPEGPQPGRPKTPGWVWVLIVAVPLLLSAIVVALAFWLTISTRPTPPPPAGATLADRRRDTTPEPAPPPPDPTPAPRSCALAPTHGLLVSGGDRARRPSVALSATRVGVTYVRYTQASQSCQRLEASWLELPSPLPPVIGMETTSLAFDEGNGCTGVILHTPATALVGEEPWAFTCRYPVRRGLECQIRRNASDIGTWGMPQARDTPGNTGVAVASAGNRVWIAQPADARGIVVTVASTEPGQRPQTPVFAVGSGRAEAAALAALDASTAWLAWRDGGSIGAVRLDANGRVVGSAHRVASLSGRPTEPTIVATATGAVLVFGDTMPDGAGTLMVTQIPLVGAPTTPLALVPAVAGTTVGRPRAVLGAGARMFVVWTESTAQRGIVRGAVFRSDDLLPVVAPFAVSAASSDSGEPDLAPGLVPLRAAVAWEERQPNGQWGVRVARLLCAE